MITRLSAAIASLATLALATCAPGGGGGSNLSPDYWGHRPGPRGFTTVILDAGHGGHDPGAVSRTTGNREKDLALDTARRVERHLGGKARVILMRGDDRFVDLDDRVDRASGRRGTVLVSIHYNAGASHLRGPETYWWRVDSHGLATRMQRELEKVTPVESGNRGKVRRRLRLTRNPDVPSILVECGYLSNPAEARLCSQDSYREKLSRAIARAILEQQQHGDPPGPLPPPINKPPSRPTDPPGS